MHLGLNRLVYRISMSVYRKINVDSEEVPTQFVKVSKKMLLLQN